MNPSRPANRLINEKSPYLLQHAYNPVDWYPWGEEAFEKARAEDKPVFLSIGYSTCHWCHVMEHESFEDQEVADLMNEAFVSIKVDREERPDIDNIFMTACQMVTGSGGWPLTVLLTPEKKPFFVTTYVPKHGRFGRSGMMDLVPRLREVWELRREDVLKSAEQIAEALRESRPGGPAEEEPGKADLDLALEQLSQRYDAVHGGFGNAPKFPTPHQLVFLLHYWKRTGHPRGLEMVEKTLRFMRLGGVYDQIGFGFHRYSTDRQWLVPHFEKMLYDQALISLAAIEAYLAGGKQEFGDTAREIFTYVLRDMTSPEGAFFSAEDADSEGEEGKFYVWTVEEVRSVLSAEEARFAAMLFNMSERGNWIDQVTGEAPGTNIPHMDDLFFRLTADEKAMYETIRRKLFEIREKRVHPHKDDKVLTDWNGLMIVALSRASRALDAPEYSQAAGRAAQFLLREMRNADGSLRHRYRAGESGLPAHVDDYAFFIWALIELYQATFEEEWLEHAVELNRYMLAHFWDDSDGGFFFTADNSEALFARTKEVYDGAVPSGNSVGLWNLLRLSRITGDSTLDEKAAKLARAFANQVKSIPFAHSQFLVGVDFALGPSYEVVIAAKRSTEGELLRALNSSFQPNAVVLLRPDGEDSTRIARIAPFTAHQKAIEGKPTAYVCQSGQCQSPVTSAEDLLAALKS